MSADVLIVGQGLAGSLLAWRLERAGIPFTVVDPGHGAAASRVAAGIINPITGQRLATSWRFEEWIEEAVAVYAALEDELGQRFLRRMRIHRLFRDERERRIFDDKSARKIFGPEVRDGGAEGFWIEGAVHVDLPLLIRLMRQRLANQGRLSERRVSNDDLADGRRVIWCTGARLPMSQLTPIKGQVLSAKIAPPVQRDVILNRGHWLLPLADGTVSVGATYERAYVDELPTREGRRELEKSAEGLLAKGATLDVVSHEAGLRATTPDRRPVCGLLPNSSRSGVLGGLGSKGALLAPVLARFWADHLVAGLPFPAEVSPGRWSL